MEYLPLKNIVLTHSSYVENLLILFYIIGKDLFKIDWNKNDMRTDCATVICLFLINKPRCNANTLGTQYNLAKLGFEWIFNRVLHNVVFYSGKRVH